MELVPERDQTYLSTMNVTGRCRVAGHVVSTLFGLALGAFLGGIIGARVAKEKVAWVTSGIGVLLSPWALYTFYI